MAIYYCYMCSSKCPLNYVYHRYGIVYIFSLCFFYLFNLSIHNFNFKIQYFCSNKIDHQTNDQSPGYSKPKTCPAMRRIYPSLDAYIDPPWRSKTHVSWPLMLSSVSSGLYPTISWRNLERCQIPSNSDSFCPHLGNCVSHLRCWWA